MAIGQSDVTNMSYLVEVFLREIRLTDSFRVDLGSLVKLARRE